LRQGEFKGDHLVTFSQAESLILQARGNAPRQGSVENKSMKSLVVALMLSVLVLVATAFAGENLKLNPKLDYTRDSQDGPLITGDNMNAGVNPGKPAYVFLFGEGCYNSKRQARRTVSLYEKYKGRVQFVIVDLDRELSPPQEQLEDKYYRGYIPHVVVIDASGKALYNSSGEVDEKVISDLLDKTLK
jgi:hypothetical protein